jgi:hypothetical protein
VPCHTDLEREFAIFLDKAPDVLRYVKNERFGFSITYYENSQPRQYFPDFIVAGEMGDWFGFPAVNAICISPLRLAGLSRTTVSEASAWSPPH